MMSSECSRELWKGSWHAENGNPQSNMDSSSHSETPGSHPNFVLGFCQPLFLDYFSIEVGNGRCVSMPSAGQRLQGLCGQRPQHPQCRAQLSPALSWWHFGENRFQHRLRRGPWAREKQRGPWPKEEARRRSRSAAGVRCEGRTLGMGNGERRGVLIFIFLASAIQINNFLPQLVRH